MTIHRITYFDATYLYADEIQSSALKMPSSLTTWGMIREMKDGHLDICTQWYGDGSTESEDFIYLTGLVLPIGCIISIEQFDTLTGQLSIIDKTYKKPDNVTKNNTAGLSDRLHIRWMDIRTYANGRKVPLTEMMLEGNLSHTDGNFAYFKSPINVNLRTLQHHPHTERPLGVYALPIGMITTIASENGRTVNLPHDEKARPTSTVSEASPRQVLVAWKISEYKGGAGIIFKHCFSAGFVLSDDAEKIEIASTSSIGKFTEKITIKKDKVVNVTQLG